MDKMITMNKPIISFNMANETIISVKKKLCCPCEFDISESFINLEIVCDSNKLSNHLIDGWKEGS